MKNMSARIITVIGSTRLYTTRSLLKTVHLHCPACGRLNGWTQRSASARSPSFFPACRNSSLSRVPASARDNDSEPYIKAINPSDFSRLLTPLSRRLANELTISHNSFSSAHRYGSPSRATSGAVQGSRQPASLLSRCLRDRYCLITLRARARGESPFADFRSGSQVALAAPRSTSTKSSSFESKWL